MKLKIITVPNPILRKKSKPVAGIDKKIKKLVEKMIRITREWSNNDSSGVGLSAVQIGKLVQIFIAFNQKTNQYEAFINPEIIKKSKKMTNDPPGKKAKLEGCLSIPGVYGVVKRHFWIRLKFQNLNSQWQEKKFSGFMATVIQHEYDHLQGILFTDRVLNQKGKIYELGKNLNDT